VAEVRKTRRPVPPTTGGRLLRVSLITLLSGGLIACLLLFDRTRIERDEQRRRADSAEERLARSEARRILLEARIARLSDPALALALSLLAVERWPEASFGAAAVALEALESCHETRTLLGHRGAVVAVAYSPDGGEIVTGSRDRTARLWDPRTGRALAVLEGHTSPVTSVSFSGDGSLVLTSAPDGTARLFRAETAECLRIIDSGAPIVRSSIDGDGNIETVAEGGERRRFDLQGREIGAPAEGALPPRREERYRVVPREDSRAYLVPTDGKGKRRDLRGHVAPILCWAVSPTGREVVTGSEDLTARVWSVRPLQELERLILGDADPETLRQVGFSFDGTTVLLVAQDGRTEVFSLESGRLRTTIDLEGPFDLLEISPHAERVILGQDGFSPLLVSGVSGESLASLGRDAPVRDACFTPKGDHVVITSARRIRIHRASDGAPVREHVLPEPLEGEDASAWSAHVDPEDRWLVVGTENGTLLLDAMTFATVRTLNDLPARRVRFLADGRTVLVAGESWAGLVDVETTEIRGYCAGQFLKVACTPDGSRLLTLSWEDPDLMSGDDASARLWDVDAGKVLLRIPPPHDGGFLDAGFDPGGQAIVLVEQDGDGSVSIRALPGDPLGYARFALPRALTPAELQVRDLLPAGEMERYRQSWQESLSPR